MLERDPCIAAPDGQYREPGLRLWVARGRGGDLAEMKRCQRLDAEVQAEVTERGLEARALVVGKCLEGLIAIDAGQRAARGVGVDGGEGADPGIAHPGIRWFELTRALGRLQGAAVIALCVERLGSCAPAGRVLRPRRGRGKRKCRDQRDVQPHSAIPSVVLPRRASSIIAAFDPPLTCGP